MAHSVALITRLTGSWDITSGTEKRYFFGCLNPFLRVASVAASNCNASYWHFLPFNSCFSYVFLNLRHSSLLTSQLFRFRVASERVARHRSKAPSNWPARRHKYYFSLVIRLYLIHSIANQLFGPLPSVSYALRMSSTSSEQVLCAFMYEVNSISKNPPSTTATAVSIREDRYTARTDCTECTGPPSIIQWVYRVCWLYPVNQLYRVYRLYRKKFHP